MTDVNRNPWPEVEPPKGWKKNPRVGQRLTWILIGTVIVAGGVTALSAGKSEVLPAVCFLALVALPFAGPAISRIGCGANTPEARTMHTVTAEEVKLDETGCLTGCRGPWQQLSIPDEIGGTAVTAAAPGLFAGNRTLAFVHLPRGLQEIPVRMFSGCDNLPAVVIPPQVRSIGARAFADCADLKDVYLPASVEKIAPDAFEGCGNVLLHVRPGSVAEKIGKERGFLCANG